MRSGSHAFPPSLGRSNDGGGSLARATMVKSRQHRRCYGKRTRDKTPFGVHQDSLGSLCGDAFETSRRSNGGACSSASSPVPRSPTSLRTLDSSPVTPAKKRYHNSWPAAQENKPSSSTLIYRPEKENAYLERFKNHQGYCTKHEERISTRDFYGTDNEEGSSSSPALMIESGRFGAGFGTPLAREANVKRLVQPGYTPSTATGDWICCKKSGITG